MKKYRLGSLMDVKRGASLVGKYFATSGKYVRLTCGNFDYQNNVFKENSSKNNLFYTGEVREEFIMKKGDIITPLTEQAIGLLGSTAIIPEDDKYIQSQDVAKIECKENLLFPMYSFYLISSDIVKGQLSAAAQQTKIRHTSPDKIKDCVVWIPDYKKQICISSVLSSLDSKIALNRRINTKLEQMAKRLYDYWFVQFDFPNEEGKPYKSSGGKMVYNKVLKREIPEGWEVKKFENLCDFRNGINYDKNEVGDKTYKIVNVRNISASSFFLNQNDFDTICLKSKLADKYLIPENSILIARSGCPGATRVMLGVEENVIFCGFIICMENFDSSYKYYFALNMKDLENTSATKTGGSILLNVSQDTLNRLPVLLPPKELIADFNEKTLPFFYLQVAVDKVTAKLTALRDRLLPMLMNGQVTVK